MTQIRCDVLIFGGGVAGLWLLDEVHRRGQKALLLESHTLGHGQTIASQGILHGGLKYSLGGLIDDSSRAVAEMPARWRAAIDGDQPPDLRSVSLSSSCCYMWRTDSLASRAGLLAAQVVVRTAVSKVDRAARPDALRGCPGDVLRVDEQVIDPVSLMECFRKAHHDRMLLIDKESIEFRPSPGACDILVSPSAPCVQICIQAGTIVLTAGEGNADLRRQAGLRGEIMQRRPLHMVLVRGRLPDLFGHCIDGNKTRATITSARASDGQTVWLVGGEIAEKGNDLTPGGLVAHARRELQQILPGIDFSGTQWGTYRINRAEALTPGQRRPDGVGWRREQSILTAWPTKLVLAPQLAREIADALPPASVSTPVSLDPDWPRPKVASPPWETCPTWMT